MDDVPPNDVVELMLGSNNFKNMFAYSFFFELFYGAYFFTQLTVPD